MELLTIRRAKMLRTSRAPNSNPESPPPPIITTYNHPLSGYFIVRPLFAGIISNPRKNAKVISSINYTAMVLGFGNYFICQIHPQGILSFPCFCMWYKKCLKQNKRSALIQIYNIPLKWILSYCVSLFVVKE